MAMIPFDDRDGEIWLDGALVPWRDAKVHVLSHGLHYASSVFEGLRVYHGKPFKLTEHSQRLQTSAKMLDFTIPYSVEELNAACLEVVKKNNVVNGYIRPVAWSGSDMMAISARNNRIHVAIAAWEWAAYFGAEMKEKGLRLKTATWRRPDPQTAPSHSKAAGLYMICTMSKHQAEAEGYNDALMLDWRGYIAEATGANIFLVMKNGEIHTPTADCFLNGITRRTVMGLAAQAGHKVVERHIQPQELTDVAEVFLTGTAAEITPVASIDNHQFGVGEVTKKLMRDYDLLVRS
ncbi:MAG: branched-chain amino acid aminotransferase [Alphaproteobacteria bacterium]|nr:MAG: branched-chain amino acid aminotransferase [Alphaproteobacteria bacterium]TAF16093.1 MAG: branched-chain amino acid aminotransferase [Alphaproteobacteria bacterium]TAF75899.1 MAG: branched-chain amino acid aminotransferase [Alphaproteobacteria bacterium]